MRFVDLIMSIYTELNIIHCVCVCVCVYATNMSRPQESGYMQATYKKRKHVKHIPFDTTARNKQHMRVVQW